MATEGDSMLRADGVIYNVECEVVQQGHDWLDEMILAACANTVHVETVVKHSGLPWRVMEDAICRLLESADLLLDVTAGTMKRASSRTNRRELRVPRRFWVWQDHASGVVLPYEQVQNWLRRDEGAAEVRVRGGPPVETVLEMSGASLLGHLDRYVPDLALRGARVVSTSRVRAEPVRARVIVAEGRIRLMDALPRALTLRWDRVVAEATASLAGELPVSLRLMAARWLAEATDRIAAVRALGPGAIAPRWPAGHAESLVQVITRAQTARLWRTPRRGNGSVAVPVLEAIKRSRRRVIAVGPRLADERKGHGLRSYVEDIRRAVPDSCVYDLVETDPRVHVEPAASPGTPWRWSAVPSGGEVAFVLVDECSVLWGGVFGSSPQLPPVVEITSSSALLPLIGWASDDYRASMQVHQTDAHLARGELVASLQGWGAAAFTALGRRRVEPPKEDAGSRRDLPPSLDDLALDRKLGEIQELHDRVVEASALADVVSCVWLEAIEIMVHVASRLDDVRVIVRSSDSPLVKAVPEELRHDRVVVWSSASPGSGSGLRWLDLPGPCEAVCFGPDVVALGCWFNPTKLTPPPFAVVHAPTLCRELREMTDSARLVVAGEK